MTGKSRPRLHKKPRIEETGDDFFHASAGSLSSMTLELANWREIAEFKTFRTNYVRITGISIAFAWSIAPKITLQGKAVYQTQEFIGDPGFVRIALTREDNERIYQLAAIWSPLRQTSVTLALETGERTSNQLFVDYKYQSITATAERKF